LPPFSAPLSSAQVPTARAAQTSPSAPRTESQQAWPREAKQPNATVLLYEPQIERVTSNHIEARVAVQVTSTEKPRSLALAQLLEQQMPTWNLQMDLDQFIPRQQDPIGLLAK
jgi:hypothetical protein